MTLSQQEFVENLMSRRHDFAMWRTISNVTAIFSEGGGKNDTFRLMYIDKEHQNTPLFEKCKDYILQLLDDYRPEHVLLDHSIQQECSKRNITEFCLRQAYKLAWFNEIYRKRHITKMLLVFVRFNSHRYYLLEARNIHHRESDPANIRRFFVEKIQIRDPEYQKQYLGKIMNDFYKEDEEKVERVEAKRKKLHEIYEQFKKDIDLDLYKKIPEDTRSDQAFALFHPKLADMNIKLTDLTEKGNVEVGGVIKYFKQVYGDTLGESKLRWRDLNNRDKAEEDRLALMKAPNEKSHIRINTAAAKKTLAKTNKGEKYWNPFSEHIYQRKKELKDIYLRNSQIATNISSNRRFTNLVYEDNEPSKARKSLQKFRIK